MLEYWTFSKEDFPSVQIQVERADTWLGRFCGLMMRKKPAPLTGGAGVSRKKPPPQHGSGLLLVSTNSIHMCFMRFAIDAVYLDQDNIIVEIVKNLHPWIGISACFHAASVIEMLSGEAERLHLEIGMKGKCSDEIGRKNKK